MKNKKRITAALMSVLCAAALFAGCGKVNVGYVDQNRIQNEAPQIKASIEEMQGKMTEVQKEAEQKLQEASSSGASDEDMQKLQQQRTDAYRQMNNLGLFKGKEKKALAETIARLDEEIRQLNQQVTQQIAEKKQEIQKKRQELRDAQQELQPRLSAIEKELKEIEDELTKDR